MSVSMRFNKLTGGTKTLKIGGKNVRVWARYICTFDKKPTSKELSGKKNKFRRFLKAELLKLRKGNLFSFRPFLWTKGTKNPLKFNVVVPIKETIDPPPTGGTPIPNPAPKGPGPM